MKKTVLSLAVVAGLSMSALAQTSPVKFGIKAGVTFPTIVQSGAEGSDEDAKMTTSFYVGGTVNIPVSDMFSVQSGLTFIGKGAKAGNIDSELEDMDGSVTAKGKINPFYLEIPVNAIVNFEAGSGKFFLGAGPYYAIGIGGKIKASGSASAGGSTTSFSIKQDIKFGTDEDDQFKRGDFGVNFLAGYELTNGFNIHAGYGLGLSNVANIDSDIAKVKNRVLSVGLGFTF